MDERTAMQRAVALARTAHRTSPNPKVGCVLLDPAGRIVGEGFHRGAGSPHAEVEALRAAGSEARGATAVVTLEPCDHTGRTGPCSRALIDAGVVRVVIGRLDPNPVASGGIGTLREAGIEVETAEDVPELADVNRYWERAVALQRPAVVFKTAATLDGRVAAADGTSRWITGPAAREQVHRLRAEVDAVLVGTGTALADDPRLNVRGIEGAPQPLRVVVGDRTVPPGSRVLDDSAPTLLLPRGDPRAVLERLWADNVRSVLLEGGPGLAGAFLRAGLVDFVVWFTAARLLGAGTPAVGDLGVDTLPRALQFRLVSVAAVGGDVRIDLTREG